MATARPFLHSTWGLPSASSCSSRMFLVTVTSPSILSYSLHNRSNSWFGEDEVSVSDNVPDRVKRLCVCSVFGLTAVTLEISLQVLRRPLSSRSLCWMTLCMAAGLSEPISISWLADNRAVSRVCWLNTQDINIITTWPYLSPQPFRTANTRRVGRIIEPRWAFSTSRIDSKMLPSLCTAVGASPPVS